MAIDKMGLQPAAREAINLRDKALAGDMVFVVTPATKTTAHLTGAWTRTVIVEVQTAAGEVHDWLDKAITSGLSVGDTSSAGTASITSTTLTLVKGRAEIVVSGSNNVWAAAETDTLTVAQATILGYTLAQKTSVETFN